jgi:hypothetical protein
MSPKLIFSPIPFSLSDVPIDSLVSDLRYPNQHALSVLTPEEPNDLSVRPQKDFKDLLESDTKFSFHAHVTRLLQLSRGKSSCGTLDLSAKEGKIYELKSLKAIFRKLCGDRKVRTWLQEGIEDKQDTYFVTALRTFLDASINKGDRSERGIGVEGGVPIGEVVTTTTTTGAPFGDPADVTAGVDKSERLRGEESFRMEGEFIYAIGYRKVILKKLLEQGTATLERDNIWRLYSDTRVGNTRNFEVEYEVFEADIEDFDANGGGPEESEGETNRYTTPDGEEYSFPAIAGDDVASS